MLFIDDCEVVIFVTISDKAWKVAKAASLVESPCSEVRSSSCLGKVARRERKAKSGREEHVAAAECEGNQDVY